MSALSAAAARGGGIEADEIELGKPIFRANRMSQFFGKSKIVNDSGEQSFVKTLMDSGAEFNIVSPHIASICELRKMPLQVALFQGRKKQCGVHMMSCCRFELQNKTQEYVKHVEWFTIADLGYDMLLGRKFCKDNGFTRFDELLEEWSDVAMPGNKVAISEIHSKAESAIISEPATSATAADSGRFAICRFQRVVPEEGKARYKRQPKGFSRLPSSRTGFLMLTCTPAILCLSEVGGRR